MYAQHIGLESTDDLRDYWSDVLACDELEQRLSIIAQSNIASFFRKHLPAGRVLEAGCGSGQWVILLRHWGYDAEGLDYCEPLVQAVHAKYPDVPVRVGDIHAIDVEDGAYGALISLGVIEHYRDGPEAILAEARRVVRSAREGGRLFISVPYHNRLTEKAARHRESLDRGFEGKAPEFFQFLYTRREYHDLLERNGLRPLDWIFYDGYTTLSHIAPGLYTRASQGGLRAYPAKALARALLSGMPLTWTGHMQMAVCEKSV